MKEKLLTDSQKIQIKNLKKSLLHQVQKPLVHQVQKSLVHQVRKNTGIKILLKNHHQLTQKKI